MKTITIFISDREPMFQVIPSDGVDPVMGLRACRYGEMVFQQAMVDAEVERRLAEMEQEADDDTEGERVLRDSPAVGGDRVPE